jgi:Tfp pilus assembly protein PilO
VNDLFERIRNAFGGLAPRGRVLLGAGACSSSHCSVARMPALSKLRDSEMRVSNAERDIRSQPLRGELREMRGRLDVVERRIREGPKGNIFTTLEELSQKSAVKVESMEPQAAPSNDRYKETKVQVVLKQVTLAQTVSFLHGVESAPQLLSVKSLRVRTRAEKEQDLLDVTFTVSSFETL